MDHTSRTYRVPEQELEHLATALAALLANWWAGGEAVPVEYALALTATIIGGSIALSLWKTRGEPKPAG